MKCSMVLSILISICLLATAGTARAEWEPDGTRVAPMYGEQRDMIIVPDGTGAVIIVWKQYGLGSADVYAQRLDMYGNALWDPEGVPVCTEPNDQDEIGAVADGAGGVIVTWSDLRSDDWDIYAQRIDVNGTPLWTMDGVAICNIFEDQRSPDIIPDGAGGAVIVWHDFWDSVQYDIYAQRVDANGVTTWTTSGIPICVESHDQTNPAIVADGFGGAVVTWMDMRNLANYDIYAQRILIDATGTPRWTTDGISICSAYHFQYYPDLAPDLEGGAVIVWTDYRTDDYDVYAQRVDSVGAVQWTVDGVIVHQAALESQSAPVIVSDGTGGVIVAWVDDRDDPINSDIYAQRIDRDGTWRWTYAGVPVCTADGIQGWPAIAPDNEGGAFIAWRDSRYSSMDIYAQYVGKDGVALWVHDGVDVCSNEESQPEAAIAADGRGGAVVAWKDYRNLGHYQIYAQRIEPRYGHWGVPEPVIAFVTDIAPDEGGAVDLSWYGSRLDDYRYWEVTHYSIWRATNAIPMLTASDEFPLLTSPQEVGEDFDGPAIRIEQTAAGDYFWEWIGNADALGLEGYSYTAPTRTDSTGSDPAIHYFQVVTHTQTPTTYWISAPDSGWSVDNLSPCPPAAVTAQQSFDPEGLEITWEPNTELDLDCYVIHRGATSDFMPDGGNLVYSECEATYFDDEWRWDSGYWYKLAAVDIHGNVSGYVLLGPGEVTGDEPVVPPVASYLSQNFPNPFNPVTMIRFGLREPGRVSIRIYDTAGRLVRVLVEERRDAGHYTEGWDGRDDAGRAVASGIYFYRIEAGAFGDTKKMVLLR